MFDGLTSCRFGFGEFETEGRNSRNLRKQVRRHEYMEFVDFGRVGVMDFEFVVTSLLGKGSETKTDLLEGLDTQERLLSIHFDCLQRCFGSRELLGEPECFGAMGEGNLTAIENRLGDDSQEQQRCRRIEKLKTKNSRYEGKDRNVSIKGGQNTFGYLQEQLMQLTNLRKV